MLFTNANLFLDGCFQRGAFRVENGRFAKILTDAAGDGIDLHGQYVIPGLVDIHNHGNSGADFSDGDYDGLVKMAKYLAANGVTSFAPASMTLPYDVLEAAYKTAAALKKAAPEGCARLMGINMEGPFFSEKKKARRTQAISACRTTPRLNACIMPPKVCSVSRTLPRSCPARSSSRKKPRSSALCPSRTRTAPMRKPAPFSTPALPI